MNAITSQARAGQTALRSEVAPVFIIGNRDTKRFAIADGFSCWEHLQGAFRCGIVMPDNTRANFIAAAQTEDHANVVMISRGFSLALEGGAS